MSEIAWRRTLRNGSLRLIIIQQKVVKRRVHSAASSRPHCWVCGQTLGRGVAKESRTDLDTRQDWV